MSWCKEDLLGIRSVALSRLFEKENGVLKALVDRVLILPRPQGVRHPLRLPVRKRIRNDDNARMRRAHLVESQGELDVIIAIPSDKDSTRSRGELELRPVVEAASIDLVNAHDIKPEAATDFRNSRVHVLIEQKAQGGMAIASAAM